MKQEPIPTSEVAAALKGRYVVDELIGKGAQGLVYSALRSRTPENLIADDHVALKLYFGGDHDERVEREIAAMEHIRHPALATLVEHGTINVAGSMLRYCAWEFIKGLPLDVRIATGPVPPKAVAAIGRDAASAIAELWSRKIVHRDVSPKNVMLRSGEREAVLIDLGVARHLGEPSLTAYGFSWGTPGYLSPEQCRTERDLTCKSDIFSLGIVLLEALAGHHPTQHSQARLLSDRVRTATVAPDAPSALGGAIDMMLHPRAVQRPLPQQVSEFFAAYVIGSPHVLS